MIDYDDNDLQRCMVKKPHEIEIFDHDEHKDIVNLGMRVFFIMMDTIPIKDETTMKIMKSYEHGDMDRVKYEGKEW